MVNRVCVRLIGWPAYPIVAIMQALQFSWNTRSPSPSPPSDASESPRLVVQTIDFEDTLQERRHTLLASVAGWRVNYCSLLHLLHELIFLTLRPSRLLLQHSVAAGISSIP
jgi:hypothetical protein